MIEKSFTVSAPLQGSAVSFVVSPFRIDQDPDHVYLSVAHNAEVMGVLKMDGQCEIIVSSGEFDNECVLSLCREIREKYQP
jgi:hypothetical protein